MNMDLYKKNLRTIKKLDASFHKLITEGTPISNLKIDEVDGQHNFIVEGNEFRCFVHSVYDIKREMDEMFKGVEENVQTIIVFGVGYGYAFDYMKEKYSKVENLVIVEPNLDIFRKFLHSQDVEKITKYFKVVNFIINIKENDVGDMLLKIIADKASTNMKFVCHISYRTISGSYYNNLSKILSRQINLLTSNTSIGNSITYKKIVNTFSNLEAESYPIHKLLEKMQGKPVIMVSAGPSINKNMHLLEKAKEKAFVVAVGSAVGILDSNGINPHLRAAFSPHENEINVFNKLSDKSIPLIHTDMLYNEVLTEYDGKKLRIVEHHNNLSRYIYDQISERQTYVFSEITVANTIFELLCMTGCSEIIFVGQDMAYTDKQQYGKGAWADIKIDEKNRKYLVEKDIYGKETLTSQAFISIRDALQHRIVAYQNRGIEFYNATEGGLNIEGTQIITLEEKLASLPDLDNVENIINSFFDTEKSFDRSKLKDVYCNMKIEIDKIYELNDQRLKKLQVLIKDRESGVSAQKLLKEYDNINRLEGRLKEIPLYEKVIQHELDSIYDTVVRAYRYDGQNLTSQVEAVESILSRVTLELQKFCVVFKRLIIQYEINNGLIEDTEELQNEKLF